METVGKNTVDVLRLPVNTEEHTFQSWQVKYKRSHILHSKCSNESGCADNNDCCSFCL